MIGWTIEALAASTLLMLVVLALRRPVAARFGAHAAYLLWLLPALRMILPRIPALEEPARLIPIHFDAARLIAAGTSHGTAAVTEAAASPSIDWVLVCLALWLSGALLYLAWQLARHHRFLRTALARADSDVREGGITIWRSPAVAGPLATGVFNRHILLPQDFERRYNWAEQRLALAHELAHHRRGDLVANSAALLMLALHWFNPIAHIAYRAFRADQELACDATVLGAAPDARSDYGRALIKSARAGMPVAACALGPATQLKRRIEMIAHSTSSRAWRLAGASLAVVLIGVGLGLTASGSIAAPSQVAPAQVKPLFLAAPETRARPVQFADRTADDHAMTADRIAAPPVDPWGATAPVPPTAPIAPEPPRPPLAPRASWGLSEQEAQEIRETGARAGEAARRAAATIDVAAITREAMAQTRAELARECTNARPGRPNESDNEAIARLSAGCVDYGEINREVQDALREAADEIRSARGMSDADRARSLAAIDRARTETARRMNR